MKTIPDKVVFDVAGKEVLIDGWFPRLAKLHAEYHESIAQPEAFISELKRREVEADVFTFVQPLARRLPVQYEIGGMDEVAVLPLETYEDWWKKQISAKTRNMVRKAGKVGVVIREAEFDDEFARGVYRIYNECPLRQGRPSRHYGKDLETLTRAHLSLLDRSIFIGAYLEDALIGYIKMILHEGDSASLMQIISMMAHRDKAPTNALLGKAVEICANRKIRYLQYGVWSRRTLGEFKKHHGFTRMELPRYFVPLSVRGKIAVAMQMHREFRLLIPGPCRDVLSHLRTRWYSFAYRNQG